LSPEIAEFAKASALFHKLLNLKLLINLKFFHPWTKFLNDFLFLVKKKDNIIQWTWIQTCMFKNIPIVKYCKIFTFETSLKRWNRKENKLKLFPFCILMSSKKYYFQYSLWKPLHKISKITTLKVAQGAIHMKYNARLIVIALLL